MYVLTHQLLAGHRVLVCHTQGTSKWAFSHSSVGRRLHQSTADVHRSPPGTGQTAASSLAVEPKSRRSAIKPTPKLSPDGSPPKQKDSLACRVGLAAE